MNQEVITPSNPATDGLCPTARCDAAIVTQDVLEETVVYDLDAHKAHQLNGTAATVWQWCDGATLPEEMIERLADLYGLTKSQAESVVWLTLDRLAGANLLTHKLDRPTVAQGITRRKVLRMLAISSLLPVVYTMTVPTAAHAQSGLKGLDTPCSTSSECASGCCRYTVLFGIVCVDINLGPINLCIGL